METDLSGMEQRYFRIICYLDILGFSTKIMQYNINQKSNIYNDILRKVKSGAIRYDDLRSLDSKGQFKGPLIARVARKHTDVTWFSDTIIIYSQVFDRDKPEKDVICSLFDRSKDLFIKLLFKGFPVRGGIAVGSFYANKQKNIYVGEALIEAYDFTQNHDWAGISLTKNCSNYLREQNVSIPPHYLIKYKVPMKKGNIVELEAIDWTKSNQNNRLERKIKQGFNAHYEIEDWDALRKLKNTIEFYKFTLTHKGI